MRIIKLSNLDYKKCIDFSETVITDFYEIRSGQCNEEKRKKDALIGKLGELAAFKALKNKINGLTEPDFNIYTTKEKSWDFDLKSLDYNIHVKSQDVEQGKKYGESWVFQLQDKHVFQNYSDKDYVVFVSVNLKTRECFVRSMLSLFTLHNLQLFRPMKVFKLRNNKVAVYYEDIKNIKSYL
jgi:hypothetical protein